MPHGGVPAPAVKMALKPLMLWTHVHPAAPSWFTICSSDQHAYGESSRCCWVGLSPEHQRCQRSHSVICRSLPERPTLRPCSKRLPLQERTRVSWCTKDAQHSPSHSPAGMISVTYRSMHAKAATQQLTSFQCTNTRDTTEQSAKLSLSFHDMSLPTG